MQYRIKSAKGYWLPKGHGYTNDPAKAGIWTLAQMDAEGLHLDGCTLERVR